MSENNDMLERQSNRKIKIFLDRERLSAHAASLAATPEGPKKQAREADIKNLSDQVRSRIDQTVSEAKSPSAPTNPIKVNLPVEKPGLIKRIVQKITLSDLK